MKNIIVSKQRLSRPQRATSSSKPLERSPFTILIWKVAIRTVVAHKAEQKWNQSFEAEFCRFYEDTKTLHWWSSMSFCIQHRRDGHYHHVCLNDHLLLPNHRLLLHHDHRHHHDHHDHYPHHLRHHHHHHHHHHHQHQHQHQHHHHDHHSHHHHHHQHHHDHYHYHYQHHHHHQHDHQHHDHDHLHCQRYCHHHHHRHHHLLLVHGCITQEYK